MGFFSRIFRLGAASANDALEKLESGKEVELSRQDVRALKKDEGKVLEGLAEIKVSIVSLQRDIKAAQTRKESYENNAIALLTKDASDANGLANQNALESEKEEDNVLLLSEQLIVQTKLEMETRESLRAIQEALRTADNDLKLMTSMSAARKSMEKARSGLSGVGKSNALERIQKRKKKIALDMDKTRALNELSKEGSTMDLNSETKKALGSGASQTSKKLEQLKARLQAPK